MVSSGGTVPSEYTAVSSGGTLPSGYTAVSSGGTLPSEYTGVSSGGTVPSEYTAVSSGGTVPSEYTDGSVRIRMYTRWIGWECQNKNVHKIFQMEVRTENMEVTFRLLENYTDFLIYDAKIHFLFIIE